MRVYQREFKASLSDVGAMLVWIESHLPCKGQSIDNIGLAFCECAHNIIEHHIMRIDKLHLYTLPKSRPLPCSLGLSKGITCKMIIKATHIIVTLSFPFKPCYKYAKNTAFVPLGGRGKALIKACGGAFRLRVSPPRGILSLRCKI
ncbi:hypothetical protein [Helicobacter marmotae]|uniref:hypothetical protein n=1 Tax=Helicobacter marmotae TaxID=152490 RepID=UPI0011C03497|nr:hypothetical protein [Helicobacter marmotae]